MIGCNFSLEIAFWELHSSKYPQILTASFSWDLGCSPWKKYLGYSCSSLPSSCLLWHSYHALCRRKTRACPVTARRCWAQFLAIFQIHCLMACAEYKFVLWCHLHLIIKELVPKSMCRPHCAGQWLSSCFYTFFLCSSTMKLSSFLLDNDTTTELTLDFHSHNSLWYILLYFFSSFFVSTSIWRSGSIIAKPSSSISLSFRLIRMTYNAFSLEVV